MAVEATRACPALSPLGRRGLEPSDRVYGPGCSPRQDQPRQCRPAPCRDAVSCVARAADQSARVARRELLA